MKALDQYELTFEYKFNSKDDEVYFATLPPYTYTDLFKKIKEFRLMSSQQFV